MILIRETSGDVVDETDETDDANANANANDR